VAEPTTEVVAEAEVVVAEPTTEVVAEAEVDSEREGFEKIDSQEGVKSDTAQETPEVEEPAPQADAETKEPTEPAPVEAEDKIAAPAEEAPVSESMEVELLVDHPESDDIKATKALEEMVTNFHPKTVQMKNPMVIEVEAALSPEVKIPFHLKSYPFKCFLSE
jgi:hypothetical protein